MIVPVQGSRVTAPVAGAGAWFARHDHGNAVIQPAQWKATGFECDKMSVEAVRFHISHVIGEIRRHLGDLNVTPSSRRVDIVDMSALENQWWKKLEGKKELIDADYAEALDCVDRELADPRNRLLRTEHIQHIMQARYDIYLRKLKGKHDEEVLFQIQRDIAAVDPTTFWGIGATGYLGMYRRTPDPFLVYGWEGARQIRAGRNSWRIADTAYFLDHAGSYKITMTCNGGADGLKIRRIALIDGTSPLAEAHPAAGKDEVAPGRPVEICLDCGAWQKGRRYVLLVEYEAVEGRRNNNGVFSVEPQLADE